MVPGEENQLVPKEVRGRRARLGPKPAVRWESRRPGAGGSLGRSRRAAGWTVGAPGSWRPLAPRGHVAGRAPGLRGADASKTEPKESGPAPGWAFLEKVAFEVHTSHVEPKRVRDHFKENILEQLPVGRMG